MTGMGGVGLQSIRTTATLASMKNGSKIEALAEYPVVTVLPVQWGDQDAFGHVNNTVPIRWFESARIAYLRNTDLGVVERGSLGPILVSVRCDYRQQIRYPDTVQIGARVSRVGNTSIHIHHRVYSDSQQAVVVEGDTVLATFDYDSQSTVRVPDNLRKQINALEGRDVAEITD